MKMFVQSPQPGLVDLFHCIPGKIRFLSSVSHRFFKRSVLNVLVYRLNGASHSTNR